MRCSCRSSTSSTDGRTQQSRRTGPSVRDYLPVPRAQDVDAAKREFEHKAADLVGQRVAAVDYWDIHNFSEEARTWDYGDWHHAVMGVELTTSSGPRSILWTNTFFEYGVEVFPEPIGAHLRLGPEGPEGWSVTAHALWQARAEQPIQAVSAFWEHIEVGPGRLSDGTVVSPAESHDVPVALRLDFASGPVWFVAGMPDYPDVERAFIPGDEIMVVFSSAKMRAIGFPDGEFIAAPSE